MRITQTYGIDSTAKLWRATTPVDPEVDDSDAGRFRYSQRARYQKSVVADQWDKTRKGKEVDLLEEEDLAFFPDETNEDDNHDRPDHFLGFFIRSRFSQETPYIGNDMVSAFDECTLLMAVCRTKHKPEPHQFHHFQ